jgi:hypothetical protein
MRGWRRRARTAADPAFGDRGATTARLNEFDAFLTGHYVEYLIQGRAPESTGRATWDLP